MKHNLVISATLTTLFCCGVILGVVGHPEYQAQIPNGANVPNHPGVGHINLQGTGTNNAFGLAFQAQGHSWTKTLCQADSDGDGQSNGLELGDPLCTWAAGGTPQRLTDISDPSLATSMTAATIPPTPQPPTTVATTSVPTTGAPATSANPTTSAATSVPPVPLPTVTRQPVTPSTPPATSGATLFSVHRLAALIVSAITMCLL
jgi:hypothetical protein